SPFMPRTLPFTPPVVWADAAVIQAATSSIPATVIQMLRILGLRGETGTHLGRNIIDDVVERAGWLVTHHSACFFERRDASLHVFEALAVDLVVGNVRDLALAAR